MHLREKVKNENSTHRKMGDELYDGKIGYDIQKI